MMAVKQRQPNGKAAEIIKLPRVVTVVNHADEQKQSARRQAVVNHLQHAARDASAVQREQTQQTKTQMGHAAVRLRAS